MARIKLTVVSLDPSREICFKVKKTKSLGKLINRFSEIIGVSAHSLRFFHDGHRISHGDTAQNLELGDGGIIEVYNELGGTSSTTFVQQALPTTDSSQVHRVKVEVHQADEEVVVQGEDGAGKKKIVFCHLEYLKSSLSPDLHLTQLAACPFPAAPDYLSVFIPVAPPVLVEYLDHYKVGGDLMQSLTMVREGSDTFLFRPPVLVEEVQRVVCVPERAALCTFLDFLEMIGPNIILVVKLSRCV